jgi:hypothetical protein
MRLEFREEARLISRDSGAASTARSHARELGELATGERVAHRHLELGRLELATRGEALEVGPGAGEGPLDAPACGSWEAHPEARSGGDLGDARPHRPRAEDGQALDLGHRWLL